MRLQIDDHGSRLVFSFVSRASPVVTRRARPSRVPDSRSQHHHNRKSSCHSRVTRASRASLAAHRHDVIVLTSSFARVGRRHLHRHRARAMRTDAQIGGRVCVLCVGGAARYNKEVMGLRDAWFAPKTVFTARDSVPPPCAPRP